MNISYLKNKNIHFVECKDWHDVYGYEKSEMKEDIINYIEQLQQENQKYKEVIEKAIEYIESKNDAYCIKNGEEKGAFTFLLDFDEAREFIWELLDILKEVE